MATSADIAVIGLGVMGRNLALNLADQGYRVAGLDNDSDAVQRFTEAGGPLVGAQSARELASVLERPRTVIALVPSGKPLRSVTDDLLEVFEPGDIIIDGGNSRWTDTEQHIRRCAERGVHFVGMGVSGGADGARRGPSLMPGGDHKAWQHIAEPMQRIAAKAGPDGDEPCCAWIGAGGSGHLVKMVHNGIEYGIMQLICEAYAVLRDAGSLGHAEIADVFARWNAGDLDSFLIETTHRVLLVNDPDGQPRVQRLADAAGQKGTGRWTVHEALELGVPVPTITAAVEARNLSARRDTRDRVTNALGDAGLSDSSPGSDARAGALPDSLERALGLAFRLAFAQGIELIAAASDREQWGIDLHAVLGLWRGGCIIRATMLDELRDAVHSDEAHLLTHRPIAERAVRDREAITTVLAAASAARVATPALAASLGYMDQLAAVSLPHNLLQAQRDAFGGHGYSRLDRPGTFTADWNTDGSEHPKL